MYQHVNPNPERQSVGDCVIRAISLLLGLDWVRTYLDLTIQGLKMHDWGNSNAVWGEYLKSKGYIREIIPENFPINYTIKDFCTDYPNFEGIVCTGANGGTHVVYVRNGDYFDSWNSGDEVVIYFWHRKEDNAE